MSKLKVKYVMSCITRRRVHCNGAGGRKQGKIPRGKVIFPTATTQPREATVNFSQNEPITRSHPDAEQ